MEAIANGAESAPDAHHNRPHRSRYGHSWRSRCRTIVAETGLRSLEAQTESNRRTVEIEESVERLAPPTAKSAFLPDTSVCGRELETEAQTRGAEIIGCFCDCRKGRPHNGDRIFRPAFGRVRACKTGSGSAQSRRVRNPPKQPWRTPARQARNVLANRIDTTLCTGETGILFLGMYSLEGLLDQDMAYSGRTVFSLTKGAVDEPSQDGFLLRTR